VFRYFPAQAPPLAPEWSTDSVVQGRKIRKVSFTTFEGLRARATYSLPAGDQGSVRLPAILLVDNRKGIPVWGNEQPLERNQWGQRAVLVVETLDRGSRALEQNLRSFADDDLVHHMKRQAMVAGTTLESMQVFEIVRSLELLRSLPDVDPRAITILSRGADGVNGMYAALLDGQVQRVILHSPTPSHVQGPHYLGVLRYTDVSRTAALLEPKLRAYGEVPERFPAKMCGSLEECLQ
jgi:cephalosporin-C deacetylase-like acetyl esterase